MLHVCYFLSRREVATDLLLHFLNIKIDPRKSLDATKRWFATWYLLQVFLEGVDILILVSIWFEQKSAVQDELSIPFDRMSSKSFVCFSVILELCNTCKVSFFVVSKIFLVLSSKDD